MDNEITEVERRSIEWIQKQQQKGRSVYGKGLDENDVPNVTNLCEELADALQYATAHQIRLNNRLNAAIEHLGYGNINEAIDILEEVKNE